MRTTWFLGPLFALSLLGVACGGGSEVTPSSQEPASAPSAQASESDNSTSASPTEVTLQDFAFNPKKTSVSVGDTVTWTNADDILHTVTSGIGQKQGIPGVSKDKEARPDGIFDQEVEFEDTVEFTFDKAGTFKYFCAIHPGMVGTVEVK
jgi:plastocyanin